MTPRKEPYTFEEISVSFVAKATNFVKSRYWRYVDREDVQSEINVWLYSNTKKVEEWLASEPQRTTVIYRRFLDAGIAYAEKQKAEKAGYHPDDVYWFSPKAVEGLMPLVLDSTFTEKNGNIGELVTMVLDIRRVLTDEQRFFFLTEAPTHVGYADAIQGLVNRLGGERPYVGRRKRISNAHAQAITSEQA